MLETSTTITGNVVLGAAVFNYTVPPGTDGQYDTSAVIVIQVGAVKSQAHQFTPTNPNWTQSGIKVGNSTLDVDMTYTPPVPGGQLGNITLNSGTITTGDQKKQDLGNATLVNWDTQGNVF